MHTLKNLRQTHKKCGIEQKMRFLTLDLSWGGIVASLFPDKCRKENYIKRCFELRRHAVQYGTYGYVCTRMYQRPPAAMLLLHWGCDRWRKLSRVGFVLLKCSFSTKARERDQSLTFNESRVFCFVYDVLLHSLLQAVGNVKLMW